MAGSHRNLRRGEYRLEVAAGEGPAGVRRSKGKDIAFDIDGGWQTFHVTESEDVYFWWRGEHRHPGVALARVRPALGPVDNRAERRRDPRRVQREAPTSREKGGRIA
ncbi:MAG TPA: hypothetical protein VF039_02910 [Longimicrobiales bacterium]